MKLVTTKISGPAIILRDKVILGRGPPDLKKRAKVLFLNTGKVGNKTVIFSDFYKKESGIFKKVQKFKTHCLNWQSSKSVAEA